MTSRFNRKSHLNRLGVSAGIGALAIITGACSESAGTDSDVVPANTGSEAAAEGEAESTDGEAAPAVSTDGEGSTDAAAPGDGEVSADGESADSEEAGETY